MDGGGGSAVSISVALDSLGRVTNEITFAGGAERGGRDYVLSSELRECEKKTRARARAALVPLADSEASLTPS